MAIWTPGQPDERHITLPDYLRNVDVPREPIGDCMWLRCPNIATRVRYEVVAKPKQMKGKEITIPELNLCRGHDDHFRRGNLVLDWNAVLRTLGLDPV